MEPQKTKFIVGLFVASGIGIALLAIIWLGMSRFLEKGQYYVTYFNESVQGLDIDSPVKYRGVSIGRVESIGVAPDSKLIQVVLKIESGQALDQSIVAQLKSVGITGSMFVELDQKSEGEPDRSPPLAFPSEYPIVASKPSDISELFRGIDGVLNQIKSLDLEGISDKVKLTLDDISQAIADANVKGISANIESSLNDVGQIMDRRRWGKIISSLGEAAQSLNTLLAAAGLSLGRLDSTFARTEGIVADNEKTIKAAIEDFRKAIKTANLLLEKGSSLVSGTNDAVYQLRGHLLVTGQNLERAGENLNTLIELLADHPSQLLFGEPPTPREVESEVYER
jgi:phospholipid/cholesterol/gamma-HCH transport system substrate-binding protein